MAEVFATIEAAQQSKHLTGRNRVYRVKSRAHPDNAEVYAVAISPRDAIAEAGPELGITAELTDPRYVVRESAKSLEEFARTLPVHHRQELLAVLDTLFKQGGMKP